MELIQGPTFYSKYIFSSMALKPMDLSHVEKLCIASQTIPKKLFARLHLNLCTLSFYWVSALASDVWLWSWIERYKTMADKWMYIPNDEIQTYP